MKLGTIILTIILAVVLLSTTAQAQTVSIRISSGCGSYRSYGYSHRSYRPYVYRRPVYRRVYIPRYYSYNRYDRKTRQLAIGANIGLGIADMIMQDRQNKRIIELEKKRIELQTMEHQYYDRYHRYQNR
jgi:hypothetical protein